MKSLKNKIIFLFLVTLMLVVAIGFALHMNEIIPDNKEKIELHQLEDISIGKVSFVEEKMYEIFKRGTQMKGIPTETYEKNLILQKICNQNLELKTLEEDIKNRYTLYSLQDEILGEVYYCSFYLRQLGYLEMIYTPDEKNLAFMINYSSYNMYQEVQKYDIDLNIREEKKQTIINECKQYLQALQIEEVKEFEPNSILISESNYACIVRDEKRNITVNYNLVQNIPNGISFGF